MGFTRFTRSTHRVRWSRRGPSGVALVVVAGALVAGLVSPVAGAQESPCRGGEGTCLEGDTFEKKISFRSEGSSLCDWVIDIDWGDGTADRFTLQTSGNRDVSYFHTFTAPGVYTVSTDGEGTPVGGGFNCTFNDHTNVVEVLPAGAVRCGDELATIVGTARKDRIRGTGGRDVIAGLGGNDVIDGRGGNDLICGGTGNDRVRGGGGLDAIYGGPGNDVILGQGGTDALFGEDGKDRLDGGAGVDGLSGGAGPDRLVGGPGDDLLIGGDGVDTCIAGSGNDTKLTCER